jgi:threonine/homoserine/homoserine lactone efflux protein
MFVDPVVGFALLVAMMALAGLDMLLSARTAAEKATAAAFMAILAAFIATLVVMIVI